MTNLLQRAASFLGDKLKQSDVAGRTIRYQRGTLVSAEFQGVCGAYDYGVTDADGIITSFIWYDWTFTTTDMVIRGEQLTPRQGDRITETLADAECIYEVLPTPDGKRCYEVLDSSGLITLVHTKKIL